MSTRAQVLELCGTLLAAEVSYPFGESTAVFKVGAKMFALVDLSGEDGRVTVKADPGYAAFLVERHVQVTPGYYMNKRHWITINLDGATVRDAVAPLPNGLIEELLEDSYALVVAGLPARLRPNPSTPRSRPASASRAPSQAPP